MQTLPLKLLIYFLTIKSALTFQNTKFRLRVGTLQLISLPQNSVRNLKLLTLQAEAISFALSE